MAHTNAYDVPIPLMQRLDVLVLKPRDADERHPELRDFASDRSRVSRERMHRRKAIDDDRGDERREIHRGVDEEGVEERPLWRGGEEGEQGRR